MLATSIAASSDVGHDVSSGRITPSDLLASRTTWRSVAAEEPDGRGAYVALPTEESPEHSDQAPRCASKDSSKFDAGSSKWGAVRNTIKGAITNDPEGMSSVAGELARVQKKTKTGNIGKIGDIASLMMVKKRTAECDQMNGKMQRSGTAHDEAENTLLKAIAGIQNAEKINFFNIEVTALSPYETMRQSFEHIHLDPDGGLDNLEDNSNQASKVPHLVPDNIQIGVAILTTVLFFVHPVLVVRHAINVISDSFEFDSVVAFFGSFSITDSLVITPKTTFTAHNLHLSVAVLDMLLVLWLVHGMLSGLLIAARAHCTAESVEQRRNVGFFCFTQIVFREYRWLQNVSLLQLLLFWHPNLLGSNRKRYFEFRREAAARLLAERLFGKDEQTATDDQLKVALLSVMMECERDRHPEEDIVRVVRQRMFWSFCQLLQSLPSSNGFPDLQQFPFTINVDVLSRRWLLQCLSCYEECLFLLTLAAAISLTVLAFYAKVYNVHLAFQRAQDELSGELIERVFVFLNQVMGALGLNMLLFERLQVFAMGGSDAVLTVEEDTIFQIYIASVVERIWLTNQLSTWQKIVIALTFEADQLQHLIMEEHLGRKSSISLGARRFMAERMPQFTSSAHVPEVTRWLLLGSQSEAP